MSQESGVWSLESWNNYTTIKIYHMGTYKELFAFQKAYELAMKIFLIAKKFPKEELYGLTSQTKRAAVSIPANIAEGIGRQYKKDTIQFFAYFKRLCL